MICPFNSTMPLRARMSKLMMVPINVTALQQLPYWSDCSARTISQFEEDAPVVSTDIAAEASPETA